jgi:hypothetical protein
MGRISAARSHRTGRGPLLLRPMLAWQPTAPAALATARALTRDGGAVALAPTALAAAGGKRQAASDTADR